MKDFFKNLIVVLGVFGICLWLAPWTEYLIAPHIHGMVLRTGIAIILAASLNFTTGITGQFSLGHAGFMSVGAYTSAMMTMQGFAMGPLASLPPFFQFAVSLFIGGFCAAITGYLVGLPSLRLKGDYLAIVTLGFGEIVRVFWLNIDAVGAARGLPGIPKLTNFFWVYFTAFLCLYFTARLIKSARGRALLSIREDEIAAQAMGVNIVAGKLTAFVWGAFFAGVAGALLAHFITYINPRDFDFNRSFEIIIMVVLGGMGSLTGATIAAVIVTILPEALRPLQDITGTDWRMVIFSLCLILLMLTRPQGLLGHREITDWFPGKNKKRRAT